jgi:hypothetical protein
MFERLLRLYLAGRIDESALTSAMIRGWITGEEANIILSGEPE